MKNEQITKRLSGDELDALLRAELENSDPAAALALLEELERREPEDAAATEAAWNTFNKHYLPMEGDTSLYEAESHRRPKVIPLIRRFSAAVVAAMLTCVLIVQAGGTNVLGTMARWTTDKFSFGDNLIFEEPSLLPEAGSQDAASSAPGDGEDVAPVEMETILPEVTVYGTLAEGLDAIGLKALTPTAIPEGYALESVEVQDLEVWKDLSAVYFNAAGDLLRFSCSCYGEGSVFSTVVPKDEEEVEVYDFHGTTYYFLSNGRYESVNWMNDELTECSISGPVTREELKAMVNSMHE